MKKILLTTSFLLLLGSTGIFAQAPYTGGNGDGHAMHEFSVNFVSSPEGLNPGAIQVRYQGGNLFLSFPQSGGTWEITDLQGRLLQKGKTPLGKHLRLPVNDWASATYLLTWKKETGTLTKKFLLNR